MRLVRPAALAIFAAYSIVHFAYSGVLTPLESPNIRQIASEMRPLRAFLANGQPVTLDEPDQYGPVFFFVMHPLIRSCGLEAFPLSRCLYGVQLVTLVSSFLLTVVCLRRWLSSSDKRFRPIRTSVLVAVLGLLWTNFSPLYYIVATKMVEMWELALILAALLAYLSGRSFLAGLLIAAGTFIKLLPGLFVIYFALRDRRAFAGAVAGTLVILSTSHLLYGPAMGFGYPLSVMRSAVVASADAATGHHENLSMKNLVRKAFGTLRVPQPGDPPNMRESYKAAVAPERQGLATALGLLLHAAALAVTVIVLIRSRRARDPVWDWAFLTVAMLLVAPAATFEYMLLAVFAFSLVITALLAHRTLWRSAAIVAPLAVAVVLVANIVPRTVINTVLPIDWLRHTSGYTHLTLSETYQYFGVPLVGLAALGVALVALGRALQVERRALTRATE
ncbi:MAG: glycosyltransferase family 87 protein [Acidobacteriota bacterium]